MPEDKTVEIDVLFKEVIARLKEHELRFAVAGGIAISIYRSEPRTTQDLDFLIWAEKDVVRVAQDLLKSLCLTPNLVRQADLQGGPLFARKAKSSPPQIVVGRNPEKPNSIGVDFILPTMPWFAAALERAQHNQLNFGFGPIPTLTLEDMIVAKLAAFKDSPRRYKDLDDLQSVFKSGHAIDLNYLGARMKTLQLKIPGELKQDVPKILLRMTK